MTEEAVKFRFSKRYVNAYLKHTHKTYVNGKKVTYRLVDGDPELDIKKQDKESTGKRLYIPTEVVEFTDPTEIEFLKSKPEFGKEISVYDPIAINKQRVKDLTEGVKVLREVLNLSPVDLRVFGYRVFGDSSLKMSGDELTIKATAYAQDEPEKAAEYLKEEGNQENLFVALAFTKKVIEQNISASKVLWSDSKATIVDVAEGLSPLEAVVRYLRTNDGQTVKQLISDKMKEDTAEKVAKNTSNGGKKNSK